MAMCIWISKNQQRVIKVSRAADKRLNRVDDFNRKF